MIAHCITSTGASLPPDLIVANSGLSRNTDFRLTVGQDYVVFAVAFIGQHVWYCVLEDGVDCPYYKPASLFLVKNPRLSRYWFGVSRANPPPGSAQFELAFREWAQDSSYYTRLVEGDPAAEELFGRYRSPMELEFPNDHVSDLAQELENGYIMCAACYHVFLSDHLDAMVSCPECRKVQHAPEYRDLSILGSLVE